MKKKILNENCIHKPTIIISLKNISATEEFNKKEVSEREEIEIERERERKRERER